jgi:putative spermidine/putrescine transport system permease protein
MADVKTQRGWAWLIVTGAGVYFVVPLIATFVFSLQELRGDPGFTAYRTILTDPSFWSSLRFSEVMALFAALVTIGVAVPAVFWAHVRYPRIRPWLEFVSLLPFVVPAIVLILGIVRLYGQAGGLLSFRVVMLVAAYGVVALPYVFRAVDNGLRAIDARVLAEAALNLGASWFTVLIRIVIPNLRGAVLAAAFLVFALSVGDLAVSSMLGFNSFGVYMELIGQQQAYPAAALAIIGFIIVWFLIGLMKALGGKDLSLGNGPR